MSGIDQMQATPEREPAARLTALVNEIAQLADNAMRIRRKTGAVLDRIAGPTPGGGSDSAEAQPQSLFDRCSDDVSRISAALVGIESEIDLL